MIDPRPFYAAYEALCDEHGVLCQVAADAARAYGRSRTKANMAKMRAADDAAYTKAEECRAEHDRADRAFTVASREARLAPRRELRASQGSLFA
jgi:hypothetical protein